MACKKKEEVVEEVKENVSNPEETQESQSKLSSRKFIVWLVWLVLTFIYSVIFAIFAIKTGTIPDNLIDFSKLIVGYFFSISCLYLGVNLVGKGVSAAKEILTATKTENDEK